MRFDDVLRSPAVQKAIAAGEEQVGKVVGRLLASEAVQKGIADLVTTAGHAKAAAESALRKAAEAANLPSSDDVAALRARVAELEALVERLQARLDGDAPPDAPPPEAAVDRGE